jgi:serine/threonine-protein kinase
MAPEQAEGRPVDARSDIFSFGALLYELLSGHRAFGGQTMVEALSAVLHADPAPLQTAPPIDRIVRRCLAKLPGQRYQTFSAVREALQQASHELTATPRARPPSIAVLPFANMSPDKENEYFSDGLAEEIITALTHVPGLKVIARTSAFAFRGKDQDIRRIAEALDVTHVLEGSVRRAGNRIRVTAQLITAADGSHLWSERYDRQLADIFAIQDEIAQEVTAALRMTLAPESAARRRHTPRLPAYDALLKARHYLQKGTPETLVRSRECYEQAGTLDPEFALVHAEIAFTFVFLATENVIPARDAAVSIGKEAQRALEIDPSLPEAHVALGLAAVLDYDWQEAGRHFQLGLARQSIPPVLRYSYALFYLAPLGRVKEAEEQFRGAVQEDPLNLLLRGCLAMYQLGIGKHAEGWAGLREALELDENFWIACLWLSAYYVRRDMFPEALAFAEKAYAVVPANWFAIGLLAGLLTRAGDLDRAEPLLDKLRAGDVYGAPAGLVCYHMVRNEIDLAADSFEKVIAQRDTRAPWILPRTFGDLLTSSPRWTGLARMMNLPER